MLKDKRWWWTRTGNEHDEAKRGFNDPKRCKTMLDILMVASDKHWKCKRSLLWMLKMQELSTRTWSHKDKEKCHARLGVTVKKAQGKGAVWICKSKRKYKSWARKKLDKTSKFCIMQLHNNPNSVKSRVSKLLANGILEGIVKLYK